MKTLTDLSSFIESDAFNILDEETRKNIVLKLCEAIDDICNQCGISNKVEEYSAKDNRFPRMPDLFLGLTPIKEEDMPTDCEVLWILSDDMQGKIPVIRSNGKYGLFRASFKGYGWGVEKFYSSNNPFRFDDVRICVPAPCYGYDGFLVIKKGNYIAFIQPMSIGQDHVDEYIDVLFGSKMSEISYLEYEEVSARQLLDELENNALQAASTYMGKTLAIRGKLDNIDAQGEYISLIGEDDRWGFKDVQCYIEDDVILERVKGLSKGDIIIVCGEVTDVGEVMGYSVTIHDIQTAE